MGEIIDLYPDKMAEAQAKALDALVAQLNKIQMASIRETLAKTAPDTQAITGPCKISGNLFDMQIQQVCGCGSRDKTRRDCHWYHCEHDMGASINCCTLREKLDDCPCTDDCKDYLSNAEADKAVMEYFKRKKQEE